MKAKILLFVCIVLTISVNGNINASERFQNKEKFSIYIKNVMMDSLRKTVNKLTDYTLYYNLEKGDDSIKVTLSCNEQNIVDKLKEALLVHNYSVSQIEKTLFVLKGVGIISYLPKDYFLDKKDSDAINDYLKANYFM